jgi:hypothetical protein
LETIPSSVLVNYDKFRASGWNYDGRNLCWGVLQNQSVQDDLLHLIGLAQEKGQLR